MADGGASEDINVTEDGNVEDFSDFSDEEATDADIEYLLRKRMDRL